MQEMMTKTWRSVYLREQENEDTYTVPSGVRVLKVLRVENHESYREYRKQIAAVKRRRPGMDRFPVATDACDVMTLDHGCNEMLLFYGTSPDVAEILANKGFNVPLDDSKTFNGPFGSGMYLAESASKGDTFAEEGTGTQKGMYAMVVCRVVAGKVMPVISSGNYLEHVTSGQCDSVCGDRREAVSTFRELVLFDAACVYTEFIVLYERVFDDVDAIKAAKVVP